MKLIVALLLFAPFLHAATKVPLKMIQGMEYVYVEANSAISTSISMDSTDVPFIEVMDTHGAWNGTVFTPPIDGVYIFDGGIRCSTSVDIRPYLRIGGSTSFFGSSNTGGQNHAFHMVKHLIKDVPVSIRIASNSCTITGSAEIHRLSITRIPGLF